MMQTDFRIHSPAMRHDMPVEDWSEIETILASSQPLCAGPPRRPSVAHSRTVAVSVALIAGFCLVSAPVNKWRSDTGLQDVIAQSHVQDATRAEARTETRVVEGRSAFDSGQSASPSQQTMTAVSGKSASGAEAQASSSDDTPQLSDPGRGRA